MKSGNIKGGINDLNALNSKIVKNKILSAAYG